MKIYVASSWRNLLQQGIVYALRAAKFEVYDFRHPRADNDGFSWRHVCPGWQNWDAEQFVNGLYHPVAQEGFKLDFDAMKWADAGVLVLPCGRSAHLEAGYFVGAGKPLWILLDHDNPIEPELMYLMATRCCTSLMELLGAMGLKD